MDASTVESLPLSASTAVGLMIGLVLALGVHEVKQLQQDALARTDARQAVARCAAPVGGFPGSSLTVSDGVDLRYPTAMAWAPDNRLFYTLRDGRVMVYQGGQSRLFALVPASTSGERGLVGLAISPSFANDHYVFVLYSRADDLTLQAIERFTDCGGTGTNPKAVIDDLPAGADCCHKAGRLAFGPDGKLFVTIGDNHQPLDAQQPASLRGKVLRYNPDGSVPADNPNPTPVWTKGLRNPFGIAFAPDGTLAVTDNGPTHDAGTPCGTCGDMFDLVGRGGGADYQWPYCWGYAHPIAPYTDCHGMRGPQYSTEGGAAGKNLPFFAAPTGVTWVTSGAFANHFVFCTLTPGRMMMYASPGKVVDTGVSGCLFDVKQGPDQHLYVMSSVTIFRLG